MKKKVFFGLIFALLLLVITGCDSSPKEREGLLKQLTKKKIVEKNLVLVDSIMEFGDAIGSFARQKTYYIYQKKDSGLIAINYDTDHSSGHEYDYTVTIYNDVDIKDNIEYATSYISSGFRYNDGTESKENKYDFKNKKVYRFYEEKFLFIKYYKIVEES